MRKRKVFKGRKGQGRLYLQPRLKRANIQRGYIRDDRETVGGYKPTGSNGSLVLRKR